MLIRTQGRKALVDMSGATIKIMALGQYLKDFSLTAYGGNIPSDTAETLGIYDTEERAIRVLDEIQSFYEKPLALDDDFNNVFQMPEE